VLAEHVDEEVDRLLQETTLWRAATSVLWVGWAIVQANLNEELAKLDMGNDDNLDVGEPPDLGSRRYSGLNEATPSTGAPFAGAGKCLPNGNVATARIGEKHAAKEKDAFDYLGCARDRVLVFWGDVLSLGIVSASDLPEQLLQRIKFCDKMAVESSR
jgi:choline kinase